MRYHMALFTLIFIGLLIISATAYPATIRVPDDYPSIQQAMDAAVNGDTVLVAPGTYVENIDFNGKGITVQSEQGAEVTVIDGGNPVDPDYGSVVYINNGEPITAILDGFTITNGTGTLWNPGYYDGGGIYCWGSSATIINNIIKGNNATDTGGGILCWEFVDVICANNIIKGNQGSLGGGIGCGTFTTAGTITISGNTIEGNTASHPSGGGGGIYCGRIAPIIYNNIISNNSGTTGGGMYIDHGSPTLTDCIFNGNSSSGNGGGLCSYDTPPSISSSTLTNCIFIGNSAGLKGGAMYYINGIRHTVINCTFSQNKANDSGGGISCGYSPMALTNTILWDNNAPSEPEIHDNGGITATFCDIKGGWSGTGNIDTDPLFVAGPEGDFYLSQIAADQLVDSPCVDAGACSAALLGMDTCWTRTDEVPDDGIVDMGFHYGSCSSPSPPMTIHVPSDCLSIQMAIYVAQNGSSILVAPGTYVENLDFLGRIITVRSDVDGDEATHDTSPETTIIDGNQSGCVVVFKNGETSDTGLEGFTIRNGNYGNYDWGGGINCINNSSPTISNNIIDENTSDKGGGLTNSYSSPTVIHCTFKNNSASKSGGGIYNNCNGLTVTHCAFYGNTANMHGGGMYNNGSPTVSACLFIENSAVINGGGMFNAGSCSPMVTNCVFSRNAAEGSGGGICNYNYSCSPIVTNCTFSQNMAFIEGGGVCNYDSIPTVTNCILWNDTPEEIYNDGTSSAVVTYSCVQGEYPGTGNIDTDPLMVDPNDGDFHLTYNSPCRDAGDNSVAGAFDFEGDPRIGWGGTVDMGADEFYTHLYITGDQTPGSRIHAKFVGMPGTTPVGVFIGSGVRQTPASTPYGDFWLLPPKLLIPLIPIPANGILDIQTIIPLTPPAPYDLPMQGLIGLTPESLTNLCVLEVR